MVYQYRGNQQLAKELDRLAAAKEEARKERKERHSLLMNIRREQKRLEEIQEETRLLEAEIRHITASIRTLPEPIHGGPSGLLAAAKEIEDYDRRKRQHQLLGNGTRAA